MTASLEIPPIKGRPVLFWKGKSTPSKVTYFPAQLKETFRSDPPKEPNWATLKDKWANLLFHGDNKEILSTLLVKGFRSKVDLIYIDPPFDSGVDYVRKVTLRGYKDKLYGEGLTVLEEKQYEDVWANDTYLQYMYERLILMRELLSDKGSIYLHCDPNKSHYLKLLMDEVFGVVNFLNDISWCYGERESDKKKYNWKHDCLLFYSKNSEANRIFNWQEIAIDYAESSIEKYDLIDDADRRFQIRGSGGHLIGKQQLKLEEERKYPDWTYRDYLDQKKGVPPRDYFTDINFENRASSTRTNFPTQKPEALLERIIKASSNEGSIVMDCFCGSGTAAAVAEKLGRRWIMADMNRGAIQTTMKRLQGILQVNKQHILSSKRIYGFATYQVNNYDFRDQNQLREVIISKYGIEKLPSDRFFDGVRNGELVKIAELNRPLLPEDIYAIEEELKNRPDEARNIMLIGNGVRKTTQEIEEGKKMAAINKIHLIDAQKDRFIVFKPAEADVIFERIDNTMQVTIRDYISPTILSRLDSDRTSFDEQILDFRSQIDCIMIDSNYDGETFRVMENDIPSKRDDLIKAHYHIRLPHAKACVAVKIIDVLGEEVQQISKV